MDHDIYVLVPGILGSVLQKDGKDVFGLTAGAGFRALFTGGRSVSGLRMGEPAWRPPDEGDEEVRPVPDLGDGVTADRLAGDAHLVPRLWTIDGYDKLGAFLRKRFGLVPGVSFFEFPYDWRRDNRVAAHQLAGRCRTWLASRREEFPDARLVLVGHSMGGLVSRYFLEVLGGWRDTRRLITFGTPYRGSLRAVDFIANGFTKAHGLIDLTDLLCSFPSVHQLLPIYRCIDAGAGEMTRLTDVPDVLPRLTRAEIDAARAFHTEIEEAVARHRQDADYLERGYRLRCVVGIDQPTDQSAVWRSGRLEMLRTHADRDLGGDGTVPRVSASPQEADSDQDAMFSSDKHGSLQNADGVHTQLRGWINGVDLGEFLSETAPHVTVETADVQAAGQPVHARLTPSAPVNGLTTSLTWVGGPVPPASPLAAVTLPRCSTSTDVDLGRLEPGVYRLRVHSDETEPVTDLLTIAPG